MSTLVPGFYLVSQSSAVFVVSQTLHLRWASRSLATFAGCVPSALVNVMQWPQARLTNLCLSGRNNLCQFILCENSCLCPWVPVLVVAAYTVRVRNTYYSAVSTILMRRTRVYQPKTSLLLEGTVLNVDEAWPRSLCVPQLNTKQYTTIPSHRSCLSSVLGFQEHLEYRPWHITNVQRISADKSVRQCQWLCFE